jgi:hypothetical protein
VRGDNRVKVALAWDGPVLYAIAGRSSSDCSVRAGGDGAIAEGVAARKTAGGACSSLMLYSVARWSLRVDLTGVHWTGHDRRSVCFGVRPSYGIREQFFNYHYTVAGLLILDALSDERKDL